MKGEPQRERTKAAGSWTNLLIKFSRYFPRTASGMIITAKKDTRGEEQAVNEMIKPAFFRFSLRQLRSLDPRYTCA